MIFSYAQDKFEVGRTCINYCLKRLQLSCDNFCNSVLFQQLFKLYLCPVKLLTFILGLYVLALPCMPCMDNDECNEPVTVSVSQPADQHNHQDEEEACAPFCNCACCGHIVTSSVHTLKITAVKPGAAKRLPSYYNSISLSSDHFGNIWQPPRV